VTKYLREHIKGGGGFYFVLVHGFRSFSLCLLGLRVLGHNTMVAGACGRRASHLMTHRRQTKERGTGQKQDTPRTHPAGRLYHLKFPETLKTVPPAEDLGF
jgi:hypothetical protein